MSFVDPKADACVHVEARAFKVCAGATARVFSKYAVKL